MRLAQLAAHSLEVGNNATNMPDLSPSFVASVAQALNSAQAPCLLWGHYLLILHGIPSIIGVFTPSY